MMPATELFETIFKAVDEMSGPLRQVAAAFHSVRGAAIEAGAAAAAVRIPELHTGGLNTASVVLHEVGHAARHVGHEIEGIEHAGVFARLREHLHGLHEHTEGIGEDFRRIGERMSELLPMLGGLGGLGSIAGIGELVHKTAEKGALLRHDATALGISTQALQSWRYAALQTEVPAEAMNAAMTRLNMSLGKAATGQGKHAASLFHHLGISLYDAHHPLRSMDAVLPQLADAFRNTHSAAMQAAMGQVLFGRGFKEILPLLLQGREGIGKLREEYHQFGYTMSGENVEALEGFQRSWNRLTTATTGFLDELGPALAPVFQPLMDDMTKWIAKNREWLVNTITDDVRSFGNYLRSIDWDRAIKGVESFGDDANDVVDALGGWKRAAEGLAIYMGGSWVAAMLAPIAKVLRLLYYVPGSGVTAEVLGLAGIPIAAGVIGEKVGAPKPTPEATAALPPVPMDTLQTPLQRLQEQLEQSFPGAARQTPETWEPHGWWQANMPAWLGGSEESPKVEMPRLPQVNLPGLAVPNLLGLALPDLPRIVPLGPASTAELPPSVTAPFPGTAPMPSPFTSGSLAAPTPAPVPAERSTLDVRVHVDAPPGTRVEAAGTGIAAAPRVETGPMMPGALVPEPLF